MDKYYIGYIFDGLYPQEAAQWCNENGACHIEPNKDGKYEIVPNVIHEEDDLFFQDDILPIEELNNKIDELTKQNKILSLQVQELLDAIRT